MTTHTDVSRPGTGRRPGRFFTTSLVMLVLFGIAPLLIGALDWHGGLLLFNRILIYSVAVVSIDLLIGYGALVSFGHAMFFSLGGYVVAILAYHYNWAEPIFGWEGSNAAWVSWPIALLVCALFGALFGWLALKTRGVQFIMITLAFAQMTYFVLVSLATYGGDDGLMMDYRNELPAIFAFDSTNGFYYFCLAILAIWVLFLRQLTRSRFGMVFGALRQNETRARNLGVNPMPFQLMAFVISAVGTGMAGILWANYASYVSPDMGAWSKSGEFLAMVTLGGLGTLLGPIAGAGIFIALEQLLAQWTEHWMFVMGPVLVLIALFGRQGVLGRFLKGEGDD